MPQKATNIKGQKGFQKNAKKPKLGGAAASEAVWAGGGGGVVRQLVQKWEKGLEPQEERKCTFCGDEQDSIQYSETSGRMIRFVPCLDSAKSAASARYFPGQSRDTPAAHREHIRGRLADTLERLYLKTPTWSCMACATVNYNALKATLERLRAEGVGVEGMRDRLRWIVATNHLAVGSAQRAAAAGVVDQKAVVVESQPWEGMRLVEWNHMAWWELPPKAFARTLYALAAALSHSTCCLELSLMQAGGVVRLSCTRLCYIREFEGGPELRISATQYVLTHPSCADATAGRIVQCLVEELGSRSTLRERVDLLLPLYSRPRRTHRRSCWCSPVKR